MIIENNLEDELIQMFRDRLELVMKYHSEEDGIEEDKPSTITLKIAIKPECENDDINLIKGVNLDASLTASVILAPKVRAKITSYSSIEVVKRPGEEIVIKDQRSAQMSMNIIKDINKNSLDI